jgi:hypothetical protein
MEFGEKPHTDKYAYVTATLPPLWDLEYFYRLIFVAQSVQEHPIPISSRAKEEESLDRVFQ